MPRETIEIVLTELDPYSAGPTFFAAIAYPDPKDKLERSRFMQAISRHTLEKRIELHSEWAQTPQLIRPAYFSGPEKLIDACLRRGNKKLKHRLAAAQFILMPHLRAIDTGHLEKVGGFEPTVNNMAHQILDFMDWHGDSASTVKSKIWKPSRPVVHAAAALVVWHQVLWEKWGRNPNVDKQFALCILPQYVEEVVQISEEFRAQLSDIKQFTIRDDETIKFVTRWL
jgi:hypothetical protein